MGKSVRIQGLTFGYGDNTILKNINLMIGHATFLSIIGPNGSGKTTLLKHIARNIAPDHGTICIDEKELADYSTAELARDMAVVHQHQETGIEFTVYDVVMMGRHPYIPRFGRESNQDVAAVEEALKSTDIAHLQERYIDEISGGERQRVMIAKALAQEPQVLLLDEPTSFLDIHHQVELLELLKKLNREKHITIVAVIHDLNLAARYSKEVMLLHRGRVLAVGPTDKVMTVEHLQKAYEMDMIIERNEYTGSLQVLPLSVTKKYDNKTTRVHIIGGGGTAKEVLQRCYQENWKISLGVVNTGDSDAELGRRLKVELAEEAPFSDVSPEALDNAARMAEGADHIILTSIPIGRGNFSNLLLAKELLDQGKQVYLYNQYKKDNSFDYVGGKGIKLLEEMKKSGLREHDRLDDLLDEILNPTPTFGQT